MSTRAIPAPFPDLATLAARFHLPIADVEDVSPRAAELVPERWARRFQVLPLTASETELRIATSDPLDLDCERTLAFATGRRISMALAQRNDIARRIEEVYRPAEVARDDAPRFEMQHLDNHAEAAPPSQADDHAGSVTQLVDDLLAGAIRARASDLHIEPEEQGIAIRHRTDGVLQFARRLPRAVAPALVSRIKIISGLDIADRLRPQDGRARVALNGQAVDLRVSTLPSSHGEKVVVRILDTNATVLALDGMGFHPAELERIHRLLNVSEGLILVTGPTGSGKTTTLYAALRQLQSRGVNIVTVEDPIEYRLPGIVQVQIHEKAGLTFASALRSIMRQDPDVLLVGEIRDRETADIAVQASLTGHLVLSTLHTNDAPSAVTRLIDVGVAPYKIATAIKGIVAQRLLRRLCGSCAGAGAECSDCRGAGFRGRLAIAEVLVTSPEFERSVAAGEPTERIAAAARRSGMRSLWSSASEHVQRGHTTQSEARRVTGGDGGVAFRPPGPTRSAVAEPEPRHQPEARHTFHAMAEARVGTVDVYVVRPIPGNWRVLALQRALDTRCPGAWETVHGHIEPGEEPEAAAVREVREETGLTVDRLYNVTVQPFYLHRSHVVELAVVFAAFVRPDDECALGSEHQRAEWLSVESASTRFHWPRERSALHEVTALLSAGDAGPVEDVLRVL